MSDEIKISNWKRLRSWFYDTRTKLCDSVYSAIYNKHKVDPQGYCPVQAEGHLPTGEYYYFRSRHTSWSVRISKTEAELWTDASWVYREQKYEGFEGGWIGKREVIRNFNKAVKLYYEHSRS